MALYTVFLGPGLQVYFHAEEVPDWTSNEAVFNHPKTGVAGTVPSDAAWARSEQGQAVAGATKATIVAKKMGLTGSNVIVVPPAGGSRGTPTHASSRAKTKGRNSKRSQPTKKAKKTAKKQKAQGAKPKKKRAKTTTSRRGRRG